MRRLFTMMLAAGALSACGEDAQIPLEPEVGAALSYQGGPPHSALYEVRITNLTAGQPMTPPLTATHRGQIHLFRVGGHASTGLQEIAENGNLAPMLDRLAGSRQVHAVVVAAGAPVPPLLPGEERAYTIEGTRSAKWLSFAAMLICTNDGFTGVNRLALPRHVGEAVTVETNAYDAGTELNTEDFDDLVPPCGPLTGVDSGGAGTGTSNPALAENGRIHHHLGIQGTGDLLPGLHDWTDPVTRVVVTRVE